MSANTVTIREESYARLRTDPNYWLKDVFPANFPSATHWRGFYADYRVDVNYYMTAMYFDQNISPGSANQDALKNILDMLHFNRDRHFNELRRIFHLAGPPDDVNIGSVIEHLMIFYMFDPLVYKGREMDTWRLADQLLNWLVSEHNQIFVWERGPNNQFYSRAWFRLIELIGVLYNRGFIPADKRPQFISLVRRQLEQVSRKFYGALSPRAMVNAMPVWEAGSQVFWIDRHASSHDGNPRIHVYFQAIRNRVVRYMQGTPFAQAVGLTWESFAKRIKATNQSVQIGAAKPWTTAEAASRILIPGTASPSTTLVYGIDRVSQVMWMDVNRGNFEAVLGAQDDDYIPGLFYTPYVSAVMNDPLISVLGEDNQQLLNYNQLEHIHRMYAKTRSHAIEFDIDAVPLPDRPPEPDVQCLYTHFEQRLSPLENQVKLIGNQLTVLTARINGLMTDNPQELQQQRNLINARTDESIAEIEEATKTLNMIVMTHQDSVTKYRNEHRRLKAEVKKLRNQVKNMVKNPGNGSDDIQSILSTVRRIENSTGLVTEPCNLK